MFITFEGPDGKRQEHTAHPRKRGARWYTDRKPDLPYSSRSRNQELCPTTELLLMFAARAQNVEQWILPALAEGMIVLSDRTIAYQGAGRGLGIKTVLEVDRIACHGVVPDLTLVIDIDAEAGLARAHHRNRSRTGARESRIDEQAVEFHRKVREAYHSLAAREPRRVRLIDGNSSPKAVAEWVWEAVKGVLPTAGAPEPLSGSSQYCS